MHIKSYWAESRNHQQKRNQLKGNKHTDVVIIGAGFTGLSTAYHLEKEGINTIVVEQESVGWGASGRNGSLMLIGYKKTMMQIAKKHGIHVAQEMLQLSLDGIDLVKDIIDEHDIDCEFTHHGSFTAAYKPSHLEKLKREQEFMHDKLNYENTIIEPKDTRSEIDSPLYHGGLIDPNSHYFHPLNYTIGLANAVENLGGTIYEKSGVTSIEYTDDGVTVHTDKGKVFAENIVIATNGYASDIDKKLKRSIIPMTSHMLATEPLGEELANRLIPKRRGIFDTKNILYYFRMSEDNRLLFGGRIQGKESNQLYDKLRDYMLDVFPQLNAYKTDYTWGGKTAVTMDFMPRIGQLQNKAYFVTGYTGHGVSLATLMGKIIASSIVEESKGKSFLETLPIQRVPFHSQHALILNVATNYFRFKDKFS